MDENILIRDLQVKIAEALAINIENLIFDFQMTSESIQLHLITVNPVHKQSFLFKHIESENKVSALKDLLAYVQNYKEVEQSFTIQWSVRNGGDLYTSYFRAGNIFQALDKFSYGKDLSLITIFSVILNPIS